MHATIESIRAQVARNDAKAEPVSVNLLGTLVAMRRQRPGVVQTRAQLRFAYEAVLVHVRQQAQRMETQGRYNEAKMLRRALATQTGGSGSGRQRF